MRAENKSTKKKKNRYVWTKRILIALAVFLPLGFGILAGYYGHQLQSFFTEIQGEEQEPELGHGVTDEMLRNGQPFSVLLLGVDEREGDVGRADTMMVATVNPEQGNVKLVSIPRDTLIELSGTNGQLDKINATYAYDGTPYVIETVEDYLEIPITFYAQINFQGLVDLVDAVGGITVDSDLAFKVQDSEENSNAIEIKVGVQQLNGEEALGYARMRKEDPRGDWGRQERQREVIQSLMNELISLKTFANFNPILRAIAPNLETNLQPNQMWAVARKYRHTAQNIDTLTLDGAADYIYFPAYGQEVYVWVPHEEVLTSIQTELQTHLELDESTESSETTSSSVDTSAE